MHNQSQNKATDSPALKPWCSPSLTCWEVEESLELNPLKFLAEFNQNLDS